MTKTAKLTQEMILYEKGAPERIHHFLKVHAFAETIAELEEVDDRTKEVLDVVTIIHDIGIKPSIAKYKSTAGEYQQIEGPPLAQKMLEQMNYEPDLIERVCFLIAHHHIFTNVDDIDHQILLEADFLVNILESDMKTPQILSIRSRVFKTKAGIRFLDQLFL